MACAGPAPASENTGKAETNEQKEKETKTEEMKPAEKAEATEIGSEQAAEENTSHGQNNEYIFPESVDDMVPYDDIVNKSDEELRLGRNEIFARHGRIFTSPELKTYFEERSVMWNFREKLLEMGKHTSTNISERKARMETALKIPG